MPRPTALVISATLAIAACSHAPPQTASVLQQGTQADPGFSISAAELRRDLFIFADDSFRGRETGTADAQRAAAFLARRVQQLGLEPAGDSLYMQRVPLVRETVARATELIVSSLTGERQTLRIGPEVAPAISIGPELPEPARSAEGDLVFVGEGPSDDAEAVALGQMVLEGRVLVTVIGGRRGETSENGKKLTTIQAFAVRVGRLLEFRPAAIVLLMTGDMENEYKRRLPAMLRSVALDGPAPTNTTVPKLPMILFGLAKRGSPLLPVRWPNDNAAQQLGRQLSAHVEVDSVRFTGYNVVAVVRGHDPRLNKTYLAYGAHYDHIGVIHSDPVRGGRRGRADSIANGADDDGSGSVALLAIARQMTNLRPRRSVLFVWHIAEEQGRLGSAYFTTHATVPIDSIVTQLNADAIGGNAANSLYLVGPRAAPNYLSWRLGMIVDSVNRESATPFKIDRKWDDPDEPDRMYTRSDHYNYAKKGIPVIFFSTGCSSDYHTVFDEPQKIDYDKLTHVARLMLESGLVVANRSSRPTSEVLTQSISSRQP
jgi:hypothetical protein